MRRLFKLEKWLKLGEWSTCVKVRSNCSSFRKSQISRYGASKVMTNFLSISQYTPTAWKLSKYGVFSSPYFPAFGLNTERHGVSLHIQSECGEIQTRKDSVFEHFSRCAQYITASLTTLQMHTLEWLINVPPR